jgi:hypothetical protein
MLAEWTGHRSIIKQFNKNNDLQFVRVTSVYLFGVSLNSNNNTRLTPQNSYSKKVHKHVLSGSKQT